jgi:hypothetical protein
MQPLHPEMLLVLQITMNPGTKLLSASVCLSDFVLKFPSLEPLTKTGYSTAASQIIYTASTWSLSGTLKLLDISMVIMKEKLVAAQNIPEAFEKTVRVLFFDAGASL